MKRFLGAIGVEQGSRLLFSDFANGGPMWSGNGPREVRHVLSFSEPFMEPPMVTVGLSMWDMDSGTNSRVDLQAENISTIGFDLVFRTWSDSRIARVRANWLAIGATKDEDSWKVD